MTKDFAPIKQIYYVSDLELSIFTLVLMVLIWAFSHVFTTVTIANLNTYQVGDSGSLASEVRK